MVGLLQHDVHVLFRPGHAALFGARVHGPVLRAAVVQRRAQLFRIYTQRFTQAQALVVGRHAGPQNEVVHHLADLF